MKDRTANIIASKMEGLVVEKDPRLNEISFGEWEGKPMDTIHLLRSAISFEDKLGGGDSYKGSLLLSFSFSTFRSDFPILILRRSARANVKRCGRPLHETRW